MSSLQIERPPDNPHIETATRVWEVELAGHVKIQLGEYVGIHPEDEQVVHNSVCSSCTFYLPGRGYVRVVFRNDFVIPSD